MVDENKSGGRNLALTIILGVFISIMVITLVNLVVGYAYPAPDYQDYCNYNDYYAKPYLQGTNCSFDKALDDQVNDCTADRGMPVYEYDANGCAVSLESCDMCAKELENDTEKYNRVSFFIFAIVGFLLIVYGLFSSNLLLQIVSLPAGAILVIEAAIRNFDDKLSVIVVLALLVGLALYLALKKLR